MYDWVILFIFSVLLFCGLHEMTGFIYPSLNKFLLFTPTFRSWYNLVYVSHHDRGTLNDSMWNWWILERISCGVIWRWNTASNQKESWETISLQGRLQRVVCLNMSQLTEGCTRTKAMSYYFIRVLIRRVINVNQFKNLCPTGKHRISCCLLCCLNLLLLLFLNKLSYLKF